MTLHIFNPEHDLALASGLANFTAPHAGRQLRHDLGWLPAFWMQPDDAALVDDVEKARNACRRRRTGSCQFISKSMLPTVHTDRVEPWGWNAALRATLLRLGVDDSILPTEETIEDIRQLSHRRTAASLLPQLQREGTVGLARECFGTQEVQDLLQQYGRLVLKAPWSSSGRGIRFLDVNTPVDNACGWLNNIIRRQGSVMAEPYYNKVKDFGMEFHSDGKGTVTYLGLSLFHTQNGAYTGNIVATEKAKHELLAHYIDMTLPDATRQRICQLLGQTFKDRYEGPFGVDMMIVKPHHSPFTCLHPCVEINLRRTMGHVALALERNVNPNGDDDVRHVMRISYSNNNYKLHIRKL